MEKLFQVFWKTQAQQNSKKKGYLDLEDIRLELESFIRFCSPFHIQNISGSMWDVGFIGEELQLPKQIYWTPNASLNLRLLKLLALRAIGIKEAQIQYMYVGRERIAPRLLTLEKIYLVNNWLSKQFPLFALFESEVLSEFLVVMESSYKGDLFMLWKDLISCREKKQAENSIAKLRDLLKKQKRNDIPPAFLHATVPLPCRQEVMGKLNLHSGLRNSAKTQISRKQREFTQNVELHKQGTTNPVMHSFEKLETVDDYEGGRRPESGEDQLEEESQALDEVELSRMTSEGSSSSVVQQNLPGFSRVESSSGLEISHSYKYPEWSVKENQYWRNYCSVFSHVADFCEDSLKEEWIKKYSNNIFYWRKKLQKITNEPVWKSRQTDGSELDIDNLLRIISGGRGDDLLKIYFHKKNIRLESSLVILADCSYSTDSYHNGVRVMDQIREAIGVSGVLFDGWLDDVLVAGTNSETRNKVHFSVFKNFDENWSMFFRRSSSMRANAYTRLGPAIRHSTYLLNERVAKKKNLVIITDGKPTDLDLYEGYHGQEDVRKAVFAAKKLGIHVEALIVGDLQESSLRSLFPHFHKFNSPNDLFHILLKIFQKRVPR